MKMKTAIVVGLGGIGLVMLASRGGSGRVTWPGGAIQHESPNGTNHVPPVSSPAPAPAPPPAPTPTPAPAQTTVGIDGAQFAPSRGVSPWQRETLR
jgi:hypothetical protein